MDNELKDIAINYSVYNDQINKAIQEAVIFGAVWQAKRMYSQEEVVDLIEDWTKVATGLNMNFPADKFEEWFKQFERE